MTYPDCIKSYLTTHIFKSKISRTGAINAPFLNFDKFCTDRGFSLEEAGLYDYPITTIKICILNDLEPPKCDCGKPTVWRKTSGNLFYMGSCSIECRSKSIRYTSVLSSRKKELYNNSEWKRTVESKKSETLLKNYNVLHPMQSVELFLKQQKSCFTKDQNGLHGYEPFVYPFIRSLYPDVILGTEYLKENSLQIQWVGEDKKFHYSYPDFFSKELNTFIEVKSEYTREKHDAKLIKCQEALLKMKFGYIIITYTPKKKFVLECYNKEYINE